MDTFHVSSRADWDLSPNDFTRVLRERDKLGLPLFDLMQSNPTTIGISLDAGPILRALASPSVLTYQPCAEGMAGARHAVCQWYRSQGFDVLPDNVLLTASSSESYSYLLTLFCNPGDRILVPRPSYPLLDQLARLQCVNIDRYELIAEDDWRIDINSMGSAIKPTTRAIVIVSPNNPTGSILCEQERRSIEALAERHKLIIICDEVFAEYVYEPDCSHVHCAALHAHVPTLTLAGLSKSAGLPQMKLGWIIAGGIGARDIMQRLAMIADTYLSVSAPVQHAVGAMLASSEAVTSQIIDRIQHNLAALHRLMSPPCPAEVLHTKAGWYACVRVPAVMSDEAWCELLIRQQGVFVHPGSFYHFTYQTVLVLCLLVPCELFEAGVKRMMQQINEVAVI